MGFRLVNHRFASGKSQWMYLFWAGTTSRSSFSLGDNQVKHMTFARWMSVSRADLGWRRGSRPGESRQGKVRRTGFHQAKTRRRFSVSLHPDFPLVKVRWPTCSKRLQKTIMCLEKAW